MRKVPPAALALAVAAVPCTTNHTCAILLSHIVFCVVILTVFRAQTTLRGRLLIVYREHVLLSRCARSFTICTYQHTVHVYTPYTSCCTVHTTARMAHTPGTGRYAEAPAGSPPPPPPLSPHHRKQDRTGTGIGIRAPLAGTALTA